MRNKIDSIPLDQIDSNDETYRITTETDVDSLCKSICTTGLIRPPLIIKKKQGYTIISGFRRIKALKILNTIRTEMKLIDPDENELRKIQLAITDNVFQRQLNLIEQSRSLKLLSMVIDDKRHLLKVASTLGLPNNFQIIEKIIKLGSLSDDIQQHIISNSISLPIALELDKLDRRTAEKIAHFFDQLKFGLNKQREVLRFLKEISIRENISILHLLEEDTIRKTLADNSIERAHKARQIRSYLKKRRFPQLTKAESVYRQLEKELKLGQGIKLIPPANFEGTSYTFCLDFNNVEELKGRRTVLDRIINNSALESILS